VSSANWNICVGSRMISIDQLFLSLWVLFSCLFACLVTFHWMSDIVNFNLVLCWIFLYSYKSLGLLWDSYVAWKIWPLEVLLFDLLRELWNSIQSRDISHHWRKTILNPLPNASWIMSSSILTCGNRHYYRPHVQAAFLWILLDGFAPSLDYFSLHVSADPWSAEYWNLCRSPGISLHSSLLFRTVTYERLPL
jgi:hypothetical protein